MRLTALLTVCILTLSAGTSFGADDEGAFKKRVARYAPVFDGATKSLCVCQGGGGLHGRAGRLTQYNLLEPDFDPLASSRGYVVVRCRVPSFGPDGTKTEESDCSTFLVLAK